MKQTIYLAHPITDYGGSKRQLDAIALLERAGYEVENPDSDYHSEAYSWLGMSHFEGVVEQCGALAFLRFPDGAIGAGVGKEIAAALGMDLPVFDISDGELQPVTLYPETEVLSVANTRERVKAARAA